MSTLVTIALPCQDIGSSTMGLAYVLGVSVFSLTRESWEESLIHELGYSANFWTHGELRISYTNHRHYGN